MIVLKDAVTGELFEFENLSEADLFCDTYDHPENVVNGVDDC